MQYAVVIIDGASGEPVSELQNRSSLEASLTPNLDILAKTGTVGLLQNVPEHMDSGSDVACLSILGYDPAKYLLGRGAIEAAALGIELEPNQVALRMNLCHVVDGVMKSYSSDNLDVSDARELTQELKQSLDDDTFTLHSGTSFRQILVVNGHPELMNLEYETPHDNTDLDIRELYKPRYANDSEKTASAALVSYMRRATEILAKSAINEKRMKEGLPAANFAWAFWPGTKPESLLPFREIYGMQAAMSSGVDLLLGLAHLAAMENYHFEGVTDGPDNDYASQGRGGVRMLEEGNDVVFIHIEAPDAAGHDGDAAAKQLAIEECDLHIIKPLIEYAKNKPLRIVALPDHPTPLTTKKHSHDAVPFVLSGPGIPHNGAVRLTESEALSTGLLISEGHRFMGEHLLAI